MVAKPSRARSRFTLVLLFVVFIAPVAGGWLWFHFGQDLQQRHFGTLYEPARPLEIIFRDESGDVSGLEALRGQWVLALVGDGPCEADCRGDLDKISRVRLSLGKNIRRVTPLYLGEEEAADIAASLRPVLPTGVVATIDAAVRAKLVTMLAHPGEQAVDVSRRVYLIDPLGNLVLSYAPGTDPAGIRKDLSRLLRVSQIG